MVLTHLELERESLTSLELLAARSGQRGSVARPVRAALIEWVLRRVALERLRLRDEHVGVDHAQERGGHDDGVEVEHFREMICLCGNDWMRVVERGGC